VSQRSSNKQLGLATILLTQHLAPHPQATPKLLGTESQRPSFFNSPRVHWMRNALAHVPKGQHTMVAAAIRPAFLQPDAEAVREEGEAETSNYFLNESHTPANLRFKAAKVDKRFFRDIRATHRPQKLCNGLSNACNRVSVGCIFAQLGCRPV
jgi:Transposase, Mutator family